MIASTGMIKAHALHYSLGGFFQLTSLPRPHLPWLCSSLSIKKAF
jgi:hypothetical protein